MLKPEEKAIDLFNRALKTCIMLGMEPTKPNAKEIVLTNILAIKEALYDCIHMDDISIRQLKKTFDYQSKIKTIIENL